MKLIPAAATNGKVLIPLATMLAAGAVAIGSGASFTSQSTHTATVTSGILHHTNTKDGATLAIGNLQPGDPARTGSLTIMNDGTLDATAALSASNVTSGFSGGALTLKIEETVGTGASATTSTIYTGEFSGVAAAVSNRALGKLPVGSSITLTYTVALNNAAAPVDDNANQNKSAGARFTYVTTQDTGNSTYNNFSGASPSYAPTAVATPTVAP